MSRQPIERTEPLLTLNAFGHYVMTNDAHKRREILRDMKFPHDGKRSQYSAALQPVIRYLSDPHRNVSAIHQRIERLRTETPKHAHDAARRRNCCAALECFLKSLEKLQFQGYSLTRNESKRHRVKANGVVISCRPELVLRGTVRKKKVVGAIKLRMTQSPLFNHDAGSLCASVLYSMVKNSEAIEGETSDRRLCQIVDIFNGCHIHEAPRAVTRRREQVLATCEEIASLWPSIQRKTSPSGAV